MGIILFLVFGLVVGFLARAIMPGRQSMSLPMTAGLGVVGSFVGGAIGSMLSGRSLMEFNTSGIIGSVLGALAVMLIVGFAGGRRAAVLTPPAAPLASL
ncbi:MAG: GlsB/YeaQ/YmgE family stress response membrane protein [Myxococcales bacterium]|nr:MAG: GlsB/YeaQ/YmgE family stress response membrane protein [Myxococcales bacterium]